MTVWKYLRATSSCSPPILPCCHFTWDYNTRLQQKETTYNGIWRSNYIHPVQGSDPQEPKGAVPSLRPFWRALRGGHADCLPHSWAPSAWCHCTPSANTPQGEITLLPFFLPLFSVETAFQWLSHTSACPKLSSRVRREEQEEWGKNKPRDLVFNISSVTDQQTVPKECLKVS